MTPQHTACALAHLRADLAAEAQHVDLLDDALRQTTCVRRADGLPVDALPEAWDDAAEWPHPKLALGLYLCAMLSAIIACAFWPMLATG